MKHTQGPSTQGAPSTAAPQSALRMIRRHPVLAATGAVIAGTYLGFRHLAGQYHTNQAKHASHPDNHRFVSVERSGGGI